MFVFEGLFSVFVFKTLLCMIFNWHNLVVPTADFQADLSWRYHQIKSIEDRAKLCFRNEWTLCLSHFLFLFLFLSAFFSAESSWWVSEWTRSSLFDLYFFFCWPQARHEAIWKTKTQNLPGKLGRYLVVMSPSQAGSSHSSSWRIFSLARLGSWPFSLQLKTET